MGGCEGGGLVKNVRDGGGECVGGYVCGEEIHKESDGESVCIEQRNGTDVAEATDVYEWVV